MSDDWDTVTKIGSKTRGGASGPRQTVVKGKSQLNAAARSGGIVATEKKYASANAGSSGGDGQRLTKVDRSDDIVKPPTVSKLVAQTMQAARNRYIMPNGKVMTQGELAARCATTQQAINKLEKADGAPDQTLLGKVENVLNVRLRGNNIGQPKRKPQAPASGA